jgi:protein TonB
LYEFVDKKLRHSYNGGNLNQNSEKAKKYILISLLVSFVFHIGFLTVLKFDDIKKSVFTPEKKQEKRLRIVLRDNKPKSNPKQIVTSEKSKKKERDPKARFLSKNTQKFDRQTTARKTGAFKEAGKGVKEGKKRVAKKQKEQPKKQQQAVQPKRIVKAKSKKANARKKKKITFADLTMGAKAFKTLKKREVAQQSSKALGLKTGDKKKSGLSANNDFVEDIPLGDMTKLNTVEYKYYGFYHRIKQKLEQYWGRTIQNKAQALWRSGRRFPASGKNRITSLVIQLDSRGNIVKINVKGSSGVEELDAAAIDSFNKAGPFPNPPTGMIKNGLATIEWGFVVKS